MTNQTRNTLTLFLPDGSGRLLELKTWNFKDHTLTYAPANTVEAGFQQAITNLPFIVTSS
jgi:hypothetical protein